MQQNWGKVQRFPIDPCSTHTASPITKSPTKVVHLLLSMNLHCYQYHHSPQFTLAFTLGAVYSPVSGLHFERYVKHNILCPLGRPARLWFEFLPKVSSLILLTHALFILVHEKMIPFIPQLANSSSDLQLPWWVHYIQDITMVFVIMQWCLSLLRNGLLKIPVSKHEGWLFSLHGADNWRNWGSELSLKVSDHHITIRAQTLHTWP